MEKLIKKYEECKIHEMCIRKKGHRFSLNLKHARQGVRKAAEDIASNVSIILNRKDSKIASQIEPIITYFKMRETFKAFLLSLNRIKSNMSAGETSIILKYYYHNE